MRILLTADPELPVPPPLYGGIERIIDSLIKKFMATGHQVSLVANRNSTVETSAFFPWLDTRSDSIGNALALRRAVGSFQPDVIHSFSRLLWLLPLIADRRLKIMSYQREPTGRTIRCSNVLHRGRLRFTGCSEYICRQGREKGGGHWTAIPNAVDLATYTFQPNVAPDAPLVFLSRIEPIKGCHNAIEIAKRSGRRLIIAGNHGEEGTLGDYWRQKILPELDRNGVEYIGPVNDVQKDQLLGQAAAMVVPIEWEEPFGIVFIEALACGTPVISCPRGALPEIVRNEVDGFLVDSVSEGVSAISQLARIDRRNCRQRVESRFCITSVAKEYESLYQGAR